MFSYCINIKFSTTQTDEYVQEYRIPSFENGTTATGALSSMFSSTGGTFTGTPTINTTYYLSSNNMIVRETDIATLNGYVGSMINNAIPMPDTTLSITGKSADAKVTGDAIRALSEEVADLPQSDWNQNDSTAADYVKNRPFYTGDPVETEIIPETTVIFSKMDGLMATSWPESFDLINGQTYTISWDGTDYVCTGILFNGTVPVLGNLGIAGVGENTGEPFIFLNEGQWLVTSTESVTEHVIGIKAGTTPIVTLNEKYLPKASENGYGVVKMSGIVSAYNFPAQVAHDQMVDAIAAFETGNASIVWGGNKVTNAYYEPSSDTISVTFADEPLRTLTFSNRNGSYIRVLGADTYRELQGSKVRITNDNDVDAVLSVEGEQSDVTLNVGAKRISINGVYGISETEIILHSSTEGNAKTFRITVDDSGKPTFTNLSDSADSYTPTDLPPVTSSDSGKFLRVSSAGEWVAETIPNASGVSF